MGINIGVLGQVLFNPMKAFGSIKGKTTMVDGIIMYVILTVISTLLGLVISLAVYGGALMSMILGTLIVGMILGIVIGIVLLIVLGLLSMKIAVAIGKGKENLNETVGFLGYAGIVDLVVGLIEAIVIAVMIGGAVSAAMSNPMNAANIGLATAGVSLIFMIVNFVWKLFVGGAAVSVANGVSMGAGIAGYFLAALVIAVIVALVLVSILAAIGLGAVNLMGM